VALFYPDRAANPIQGRHLDYHWNGSRVDFYREPATRTAFSDHAINQFTLGHLVTGKSPGAEEQVFYPNDKAMNAFTISSPLLA